MRHTLDAVTRVLGVAAAAIGAAVPAQAAAVAVAAHPPAESAGAQTRFEPAFFAPFAPQTAMDMVARVPGFQLDDGDNRRGFGGAAGNVLIDGERPSAKSQGLYDVLSNIPASRVAYLELIRGGGGLEASGQAVVLNVVRTDDAGGGVWDLELERSQNDRISPRGSASWTGALGAVDYTVGVKRFQERLVLEGVRDIRTGAGAATGARTDFSPRTFREASLTFNGEAPLFGGDLRLNGEVNRWLYEESLDSLGRTPGGAISDSFRLEFENRERGREIGGDYERAFGPVRLKLIALDSVAWFAGDGDQRFFDAAARPTETSLQRSRNRGFEQIVRGTARWSLGRHALEIGAERARNGLETDFTLIQSAAGGLVQLPSSDVIVEETRTEAYAADVWTPAEGWTIDSRLTVETSAITQVGDAQGETDLTYWKPALKLSRALAGGSQLRMSLERDVAQLDFGDFASSAALADDRVAAGNAALRPQTSWKLESVYDARFGKDAAWTFTVGLERIEDTQDSIPLRDPASGQVFDAPGNIGDADVRYAKLEGETPLAFVPGGKLELEVAFARTEATDPVTGAARSLSYNTDEYYELEFRQDLAARKLAWGFEISKGGEIEAFRVAERETYEEGADLNAFVETTAWKGAKVRLFAWNLLDREFTRERRFFAGDRNGPVDRVERRERTLGRYVGVNISGTI